MKKIISIICPLYKGQKYVEKIVGMIEKNIEAIRATHEVELVFVNDFPEQEIELPVSRKLHRLRLITNQKNVGIHKSRVNGLAASRGEYVLFLDQDDEIAFNYLQSQIEKIENADAVVCNGIWRKSKKIYDAIEQQKEVVCHRKIFPYIVSPGQVLIKKNAVPIEWTENFLEHNGCDDALLWNLMLTYKKRFSCNNECLYVHVEENENASCNYREMLNSLQDCFNIFERLRPQVVDSEYIEIRNKKIRTYQSYVRLTELLALAEKNKEKIIANLEIEATGKIAIYGYGYFGQRLHAFLQANFIDIAYVVDKDKSKYLSVEDVLIFEPTEDLPQCDLMIVTPIFEYEAIRKGLERKILGKIQPMDVILQ